MKPFKIKNTVFGEGTPKICIPITGQNNNEIFNTAEKISRLPHDLIEWRADFYENVTDKEQVAHILKRLRKFLPESLILFTFRTAKEGGQKMMSDGNYLSLNEFVIKNQLADLVDLEIFTGAEINSIQEFRSETSILHPLISLAHENGTGVILSNHDFQKTPAEAEILGRLALMESMKADIAKIAVMPKNERDILTLLSATIQASENLSCPIITMSMGSLGVISRVSGRIFGSCLTFGTAGRASAPGQLEAEILDEILKLL